MLPENVRAIVACMPQSSTLEQQAQTADQILETTSTGSAAVNAIRNDPLERIEQRISRLEEGLTTLFTRDDRHDRSFKQYRSPFPRREHGSGSSYSTNNDWGKLCFYHERFGSSARNCQQPCSWTVKAGNGQSGAAKRQPTSD